MTQPPWPQPPYPPPRPPTSQLASQLAVAAGIAGMCIAAGYALMLIRMLDILSDVATVAREVGARGDTDDATGGLIVVGGGLCVLTFLAGHRARRGRLGSLVWLVLITGGFAVLTHGVWDDVRGSGVEVANAILGGRLRELVDLMQLLNGASIIVAALSAVAVVVALSQPAPAPLWQGAPGPVVAGGWAAPPPMAAPAVASAEAIDAATRAALSEAVRRDDVATARELVRRHPWLLGERERLSPWLVSEGSVAMLEAFLDEGAAIDGRGDRGLTALMVACGATGKARRDHAFALLRRGASPANAATDGWTPLMYAARTGDTELAAALLDRGADVDAVTRDEYRLTALLVAAATQHEDTAVMLVERGADSRAATSAGVTALAYAQQHDLRRLAARLLPERDRDPAPAITAPAEIMPAAPMKATPRRPTRIATWPVVGGIGAVAVAGVVAGVVAMSAGDKGGERKQHATAAAPPPPELAGSRPSSAPVPVPVPPPSPPQTPPVAIAPPPPPAPPRVPVASQIELLGWDPTSRRAVLELRYRQADGAALAVRMAADPRVTIAGQLGGPGPYGLYRVARQGSFVDPGVEWLWQTAQPDDAPPAAQPVADGARSPTGKVRIAVDAEANPREGRMSPVAVEEVEEGYRVTWRRWKPGEEEPTADGDVRLSKRNVVTFMAVIGAVSWDLLPLEGHVSGSQEPDVITQIVAFHWTDRRLLITVNETADDGVANGSYFVRGLGPQIKILYPPGQPASGSDAADRLEQRLGWAPVSVEENAKAVAPGVYYRRESADDAPFDTDAGNPSAARRIRAELGLPRPDKEQQKMAWIDLLVVLP